MTLINETTIISGSSLKSYIVEIATDHIDIHISQLDELVTWIANDGEDQLMEIYMMEELQYDIHLIPTPSGTVDAYLEAEEELYWIGTIYDDGEISYMQNVRRAERGLAEYDESMDDGAMLTVSPHLSYEDAPSHKYTMHKLLDVVKNYLLS